MTTTPPRITLDEALDARVEPQQFDVQRVLSALELAQQRRDLAWLEAYRAQEEEKIRRVMVWLGLEKDEK
jgi:hypothetical protein